MHDHFNEINSRSNTKNEYRVNVSIMQSVDKCNFEGTKSYNDSKSFDCGQTQCHSYCGNVKGYNDERNVYREKGSRKYQSHRMTSGISLAQDNR